MLVSGEHLFGAMQCLQYRLEVDQFHSDLGFIYYLAVFVCLFDQSWICVSWEHVKSNLLAEKKSKLALRLKSLILVTLRILVQMLSAQSSL